MRSLFSQMEGSAELEGENADMAVFQEVHDQDACWGKGPAALLGDSEDSLSKSLANLDNVLQVPWNCRRNSDDLSMFDRLPQVAPLFDYSLFEPGALQGFASDVANLVSRRTGVFFFKTLHVFCVPVL